MSAGLKHISRFYAVATNTLLSLIPSIGNQLFSIVIIRLFVPEWWGVIVELQLVQYVLSGLCAWGNREFLIREFSKSPSQVKLLFGQFLITRLGALLFPALLLTTFLVPAAFLMHVLVWIVCRFLVQSFEPAINLEKSYTRGLLVEITAALFLSAGLFFAPSAISLNDILWLISISNIIRLGVTLVFWRSWAQNLFTYAFDPALLKAAFPFMLLSFTGLLQTKIDLVIVDAFMPKKDLGTYQILTNLAILLKAGASFMVYPFLKNFYRLSPAKTRKAANNMLMAGIPLCLLGVFIIQTVLTSLYKTNTEFNWYVWLFLSAVPLYWYTLFVFRMFKENNIHRVTVINIAGILVNALGCLLLIDKWQMSGALIATAASQFTMAGCYMFYAFSGTGKANGPNTNTVV